jgi:hypothetical protein
MERDIILQRLTADLIGPMAPDEALADRPSDIYLTGILWPWETRMDQEEAERLAAGGADEEGGIAEEDEVPLAGQPRPCTAGVSFAVACDAGPPQIDVTVRCGTYAPGEPQEGKPAGQIRWTRRQHEIRVNGVDASAPSQLIDLAAHAASGLASTNEHGVPSGLQLHIRAAPSPSGRLVTATAINKATFAPQDGRKGIEEVTLFQVAVEVVPHGHSTRLVARPPRRAVVDDDDRSAALLYRKAREFAVGHTCSATWAASRKADHVESVSTTWIPTATVPAVRAQGHQVFESLSNGAEQVLAVEWLSTASEADLERGLPRLVEAYRKWLEQQRAAVPALPTELQETALRNLSGCELVAERMEEGARFVARDPVAAQAFRLANRAMQIQHAWDPEKATRGPLSWRPFQLGFVLLASASVAMRDHPHRKFMDLLWFPTGGGKTEAYLALVAFLAFHRRLSERNPADGAGVAAVMRYTLRLLTTQQFTRAAAMILACEAIRRGKFEGTRVPELGSMPFSIGLWVGGDATPNNYEKAVEGLSDPNLPSPKQLVTCPACQRALSWSARADVREIQCRCLNQDCLLHHPTEPLPVWTVDEDVYRKAPTLLIGTVDKFAQIVRKKEINAMFAVTGGRPPDLVIQDELHLISGPLGTVVGLYETIIDRLFTRDGLPPKIIGSTATIRRAADQVGALFARDTCQFPPPALDAADSGFAVVDDAAPGRLYVGLTTAGRSAKFSLQAAAGSLLQSGAKASPVPDRQDPYWTLVSYFNSLRELGGALVLMQDDVADTIGQIADRRGEDARRANDIEELTSRRSQAEVRDMLDLLARRVGEDGALDAVLASNMLSVGVDVPRLGLMLVNGQPKGIAEYIQATSRVGRRHPGLVVALFNHAKARDRSHFETFRTWHQTLYRDVEATSVTPFASRARDRALHATLVALVRHLVPGMLDSPDLSAASPKMVDDIVDGIVSRATAVDPTEPAVAAELRQRVDAWLTRAPRTYWNDWQVKGSLLQSAERAATQLALGRLPGEAWPTANSMRNVEPSTPFRMAEVIRAIRNHGDGDGQ